MLLKPPQSKLLLGVATLALALASGGAMAGAPDRTATSLWGPSSLVWVTEKPVSVKSTSDITPNAAPRDSVQGEKIAGPNGKMKWCTKKHHGHKEMAAAHEQAKAANTPLKARLETLHHEVKALWTAKTFDRDAFLGKRAEIRDLRNQIAQNNDTAAANAAAQMSAEQRAQISPCWFQDHHRWFHKKMQRRHHGAHKKHHARTTPQHTVKPATPLKATTTPPEAEHTKTAEPPKALEKTDAIKEEKK